MPAAHIQTCSAAQTACRAGGMARAAPLAALLEGMQDLAACVLAHLPLKALGLLARTSSGMRAVVALLPEPLWQVRLQLDQASC